MSTNPEHWFLSSEVTARGFTVGNNVEAFVDGRGYFADLKSTLDRCNTSLLIAGWRVSSGQILDPAQRDGLIGGETWLDAVRSVRSRGADVRALLFNVPGTGAPGPFRFWHALDNREFCDQLIGLGGEAILDSRFSPVPASSHHQKFIVALCDDAKKSAGYLGGIDVCYDRWDQPPHDQAPERQRDFVRGGGLETHQPSQPGWHDIQVKIQGPALAQIWAVFRDRWNDPRKPNHDPFLANYCGNTRLETLAPIIPPVGTMAVQINLTLPEGVFPDDGGAGDLTIARAHEHAIDQAAHYIYVEDQYVWPCSLVDRLEAALRRGVRVLLIVARDYDAPGLSIVSRRLRGQVIDRLRAAAPDLFKVHHLERANGEQIYVHSKLIIIDDRFVSVGSANFNARSLINDTEIQASIVDSDTFESAVAGKPMLVCRFAHNLRCRLWAEHLEIGIAELRDPVRSFDELWSKAPLAPSRRAVPHVVTTGLLHLDGVAEYLTTLITTRMAVVPLIPIPPGVTERSAVKLLVDTALRGPLAAGLIKFVEELLNPDVNTTLAAVERVILHPIETLLPKVKSAQLQSTTNTDEAGSAVRNPHKGRLSTIISWIRNAVSAK